MANTNNFLARLLLPAIGMLACLNSAHAEPTSDGKFALYGKDNLVAWCVVPFDSEQRTPAERTRMLKELGFRSMAWDWRQEHLGLLESEVSLLNEAQIELKGVWCWFNGKSNGGLGEANEQLLTILERTGVETEIWVSFAERFFAGLSDEERVAKAADRVALVRTRASAIGCRVCLYNHSGWFGEPRNMVRVIRHLGVDDIGLVYNFHHAHTQLGDYQANLTLMMPYLRTVNLNGMRVEGPKILPLGAGDREELMMRQLKESGFTGSIGILGHVEDADVQDVLAENLAGLKKLLQRMGETQALATY